MSDKNIEKPLYIELDYGLALNVVVNVVLRVGCQPTGATVSRDYRFYYFCRYRFLSNRTVMLL